MPAGLREQWEGMRPEQRVEHLKQPAHLYAYMSGFVPRGTTEGRIRRFFACLEHLGVGGSGRPVKLALSAAACAPIALELDALIEAGHPTEPAATVDERALTSIMLIQRLVEADVATQGWSYDTSHDFAFRTAPVP